MGKYHKNNNNSSNQNCNKSPLHAFTCDYVVLVLFVFNVSYIHIWYTYTYYACILCIYLCCFVILFNVNIWDTSVSSTLPLIILLPNIALGCLSSTELNCKRLTFFYCMYIWMWVSCKLWNQLIIYSKSTYKIWKEW